MHSKGQVHIFCCLLNAVTLILCVIGNFVRNVNAVSLLCCSASVCQMLTMATCAFCDDVLELEM